MLTEESKAKISLPVAGDSAKASEYKFNGKYLGNQKQYAQDDPEM